LVCFSLSPFDLAKIFRTPTMQAGQGLLPFHVPSPPCPIWKRSLDYYTKSNPLPPVLASSSRSFSAFRSWKEKQTSRCLIDTKRNMQNMYLDFHHESHKDSLYHNDTFSSISSITTTHCLPRLSQGQHISKK